MRHNLFESLEPRRLQAAVTAAWSSTGLRITGTDAADTISIRLVGQTVQVTDLTGGKSVPVCAVSFTRAGNIFVDGRGGDDELRVDFKLHNNTTTRSIDTRRLYVGRSTKLTGDYAVTPLPGVYGGLPAAWLAKDQQQRNNLTAADRAADVLLLGDSMAERFRITGHQAFNSVLASRHVADLGLTGDSTSQVLYRIQTGLLNGFAPKVVVLVVGANNLYKSDSVDSALLGIRATIHAINAALPGAKVLINSIFPQRDDISNDRITQINARLATWADGNRLRFLDLTSHYAGAPVREALYLTNNIHLSLRGYRLWASLLAPEIDSMLA